MTTSTPAPDNLPKLAYRIDEAVKATGLGRSFLYERMAEGSLKSVKIGGRRLILHEELLAFLHQPAAEPLVAPVVKKPEARETHPAKADAKPKEPSSATSDQMELPLK